jgi:hypothetical protein
MLRSNLMLAAVLLLCAGPTLAEEDDGSCVHNRELYPEGYELCENGTLRRCDEGAWADIGECERDAEDRPRSGGGDELAPEEPRPRR